MDYTPLKKKVNKQSTAHEQGSDLGSWQQLGTPLIRVLTDCASAYAKNLAQQNGGGK